MKIELSQGYKTAIDRKDYALVMTGAKWFAHIMRRKDGTLLNVYARRNVRINGKRTSQLLHRFLLGVIDDLQVEVDHKDGDGLNNKRTNLRVCTRAQNQQNQGRLIRNVSGFPNVHWETKAGKWRVKMRVDGKYRHLGYFDNIKDAVKVATIERIKITGFARGSLCKK